MVPLLLLLVVMVQGQDPTVQIKVAKTTTGSGDRLESNPRPKSLLPWVVYHFLLLGRIVARYWWDGSGLSVDFEHFHRIKHPQRNQRGRHTGQRIGQGFFASSLVVVGMRLWGVILHLRTRQNSAKRKLLVAAIRNTTWSYFHICGGAGWWAGPSRLLVCCLMANGYVVDTRRSFKVAAVSSMLAQQPCLSQLPQFFPKSIVVVHRLMLAPT